MLYVHVSTHDALELQGERTVTLMTAVVEAADSHLYAPWLIGYASGKIYDDIQEKSAYRRGRRAWAGRWWRIGGWRHRGGSACTCAQSLNHSTWGREQVCWSLMVLAAPFPKGHALKPGNNGRCRI